MKPYSPRRLAAVLVGALAPLILAFSVFVANEAQTLFGMHLRGDALAGYIAAFLLAVGTVLFRLLEREAASLMHELMDSLGKALAPTAAPQAPQAPPSAPPAPVPAPEPPPAP